MSLGAPISARAESSGGRRQAIIVRQSSSGSSQRYPRRHSHFECRNHAAGRIHVADQPTVVRLHESRADRGIEECNHRLPESVGVNKRDWFAYTTRMQPKLAPGCCFENLIERAIATRQRAEAVRDVVHMPLAAVHVIDHNQLGKAGVSNLAVAQAGRDDTGHLSPMRERRISHRPHQPDMGAAINQANPAVGQVRAEGDGEIDIVGIGAVGRTAEHTNTIDLGHSVHRTCRQYRQSPVSVTEHRPTACNSGSMANLVALDMEPSTAFVAELQRAWDAGDAVLPVDQRLPPSAKAALFEAMAPGVVIDTDGRQSRPGTEVEDGDALVVPTSGTMGEPKGVVLTHDAVAASARITSRALDIETGADHWLCCLPPAHIGGLSVITRALHTNTALTVQAGIYPAAINQAADAGATLISLVVAALDRVDTKRFRRILLGGSAIPAERADNTVATYGMTETASGVVYEGYPLDGVELRIVDGEIELRSPTLLRAYRDRSDSVGHDPLTTERWFQTGDGGSLAADGRLSVTGRLAEVINTGGEKVWPVQIERALRALNIADDLAVVGRPDPEWGQAVTAVLVLGGRPEPHLAEIRDRLRDTLAPFALPRAIETVPSLPRTSLGKVIINRL
jgi:O-succinylbenzoic acid--CoA ligase